MKHNTSEYPLSDLTDTIISAAFYVANGYKLKGVSAFDNADELHDKYRDDINNLLNKRGIPSVIEKHIPKPVREGLVIRMDN